MIEKIINMLEKIRDNLKENSKVMEDFNSIKDDIAGIIKEEEINNSKKLMEYDLYIKNELDKKKIFKDKIENLAKENEELTLKLSEVNREYAGNKIELKNLEEKILNLNTEYKLSREKIDTLEITIKELYSKINDEKNLLNIVKEEKNNEKIIKESLQKRLDNLSFIEKIDSLFNDEKFMNIFRLQGNTKDYFELAIKINTLINKLDFVNYVKEAYEKSYDLHIFREIFEVYAKINGYTLIIPNVDEDYENEYFISVNGEKIPSRIKKLVFPGIEKNDIVKQKAVVIIED